jgi:hypothetical protein
MTDVFEVQDEIAVAVVEELKIKLLGAWRKRFRCIGRWSSPHLDRTPLHSVRLGVGLGVRLCRTVSSESRF